jgi:hypothetical protein
MSDKPFKGGERVDWHGLGGGGIVPILCVSRTHGVLRIFPRVQRPECKVMKVTTKLRSTGEASAFPIRLHGATLPCSYGTGVWRRRAVANEPKRTKLLGLSPRANYTDRATVACPRSECQLLWVEGWRLTDPLRPYSRFSRSQPLLFLPNSSSRGWDPVSDPVLVRKPGSAGNRKRTSDH